MTRSLRKATRKQLAAAGIALTALTAIAAVGAAFFGTQISSAEAPAEAPAA
nr:hypothetical protein [Methylibium sp.]